MPRLSVPLTQAQHEAIKARSEQTGVPQAEVARRFLLAWVRGKVEIPGSVAEHSIVGFPKSGPFRCYCGRNLQFPEAIDAITCPTCGDSWKRVSTHSSQFASDMSEDE